MGECRDFGILGLFLRSVSSSLSSQGCWIGRRGGWREGVVGGNCLIKWSAAQFSKSRPIPVAWSDRQDFYRSTLNFRTLVMLENVSFSSETFLCWSSHSLNLIQKGDQKPILKDLYLNLWRHLGPLVQCYLIQINILGQFIAIIGVTNKMAVPFIFSLSCVSVNCLPTFHQTLPSFYLGGCGWFYVFWWQLSEYNSP